MINMDAYLEANPGMRERLGKEPDRDIAEAYPPVQTSTVRFWRLRLGILKAPRAAYRHLSSPLKKKQARKPVGAHQRLGFWLEAHPELIERIGKEPDRDIAEAYPPLRVGTVRAWRLRLGISGAPRAPRRTPVTAHDPRIGKVPDRVLAKEYGVSRQAIAMRRKRAGVSTCVTRDRYVSEKVAAVADRLGTVHDAVLAKEIGVSESTIRTARARAGIVAARIRDGVKYAHLLGKKPDSAIAKMYGIRTMAVFHARKRRGILSFRKQKKLDEETRS